MNKIIFKIALIAMTTLTIFFASVGFIHGFIYIGSIEEEASAFISFTLKLFDWITQTPWWAFVFLLILAWLAIIHFFKEMDAKEVVIKSDHVLVDLRSGSTIGLNFGGHYHALLQPNSDVNVDFPDNLDEGIYRLFVLCQGAPHTVTFSDRFQLIGSTKQSWLHPASSMTEYKIISIKRSGGNEVFVSNPSAELESLLTEIDEAEKRSLSMAVVFGGQ